MTIEISLLILSGLISFGFTMIAYMIQRNEKRRAGREEIRDVNMLCLINCNNATLSLTEAVAIAMKNGKCNGEIDAARQKANQVRNEYSEFLTQQGVKHLR